MSTLHSPRSAAIAIAASIAESPTLPVSVQWLSSEFPVSVVQELVGAGHSIAWAVGSKARAELAIAAFGKAGLKVRNPETKNALAEKVTGIPTRYVKQANPFEVPKADPKSQKQRRAVMPKMTAVRLQFRKYFSDADIGQPMAGTITVLQAAHLNSSKVAEAIADWTSPVVVLDHLTDLHIRWKEVRNSDAARNEPSQLDIRQEDKYAPQILAGLGIPHAFLMRDEWACALLASHFRHKEIAFLRLETKFEPSPMPNVCLLQSEFAQSKYDGAAFLALKASTPSTKPEEGVQIVGNGLFASISPARLSMSGERLLGRAVLKLAQPSRDEIASVKAQDPELLPVFAAMRARDHVRTAMLAFDASRRHHELVVIAAANIAQAVTEVVGVAKPTRLSWRPFGKPQAVSVATKFQRAVVDILQALPDKAFSASRYARIKAVVDDEIARSPDAAAKRMARLLWGLQNLTCEATLDLSLREELSLGLSPRADPVVRLVSRLLDESLPWKPTDIGTAAQGNLAMRRQLFELYKTYRTPS